MLNIADITVPPRPVNISLNSVAEFTCTAVANGFAWKANGQQLDNEDEVAILNAPVNELLNIRISTLRVLVTSTDNDTNITCVVVSLNPFTSDESDSVLLLVQGIMNN